MLKIERFVNQLMSSNCYVVVDKESRHCLCIDPASEQSEREMAFIEHNGQWVVSIMPKQEKQFNKQKKFK